MNLPVRTRKTPKPESARWFRGDLRSHSPAREDGGRPGDTGFYVREGKRNMETIVEGLRVEGLGGNYRSSLNILTRFCFCTIPMISTPLSLP